MQAPQARERQPPRALRAAYRAALVLVFALVGALAVGSLYALARPADSAPLFYLGRQGGGAGPGGAGAAAGGWAGGGIAMGGGAGSGPESVFAGIGTLRAPLAGQPPATVVLSLSFPYPAGDMAFAEELATRVGELRSIAVGYFSSLRREEIARLDETAAKNEILARYNALLRLGRIETLYFTDLVILE